MDNENGELKISKYIEKVDFECSKKKKCSIIAGDLAYLLDNEALYEPENNKLNVSVLNFDKSDESSDSSESDSDSDSSVVEVLDGPSIIPKVFESILIYSSSDEDIEQKKPNAKKPKPKSNCESSDLQKERLSIEKSDIVSKDGNQEHHVISELLSTLVLQVDKDINKNIKSKGGNSDASDVSDVEDDPIIRHFIIKQENSVSSFVPKVRNEVLIEELPEENIEKIELTDSDNLNRIGVISSVVEKMIVVRADLTSPAVDEETALFLEDKTFLGKVFDTFGPVKCPFYSIRLQSNMTSTITTDTVVYFVPYNQQLTKYVFVEELKKLGKGSDASWKNDCEPPVQFLDYSDDEAERMMKKQLKNRNKSKANEENVTSAVQPPSNYLKRQRDNLQNRNNTQNNTRHANIQNSNFLSNSNRNFNSSTEQRMPHPNNKNNFRSNIRPSFNQRGRPTPSFTPRHISINHQSRFVSEPTQSSSNMNYEVLNSQRDSRHSDTLRQSGEQSFHKGTPHNNDAFHQSGERGFGSNTQQNSGSFQQNNPQSNDGCHQGRDQWFCNNTQQSNGAFQQGGGERSFLDNNPENNGPYQRGENNGPYQRGEQQSFHIITLQNNEGYKNNFPENNGPFQYGGGQSFNNNSSQSNSTFQQGGQQPFHNNTSQSNGTFQQGGQQSFYNNTSQSNGTFQQGEQQPFHNNARQGNGTFQKAGQQSFHNNTQQNNGAFQHGGEQTFHNTPHNNGPLQGGEISVHNNNQQNNGVLQQGGQRSFSNMVPLEGHPPPQNIQYADNLNRHVYNPNNLNNPQQQSIQNHNCNQINQPLVNRDNQFSSGPQNKGGANLDGSQGSLWRSTNVHHPISQQRTSQVGSRFQCPPSSVPKDQVMHSQVSPVGPMNNREHFPQSVNARNDINHQGFNTSANQVNYVNKATVQSNQFGTSFPQYRPNVIPIPPPPQLSGVNPPFLPNSSMNLTEAQSRSNLYPNPVANRLPIRQPFHQNQNLNAGVTPEAHIPRPPGPNHTNIQIEQSNNGSYGQSNWTGHENNSYKRDMLPPNRYGNY